jgi:hypothetical protein
MWQPPFKMLASLERVMFEPVWMPLVPASWLVQRVERISKLNEALQLGVRGCFDLEALHRRIA